MSWILTLWPAFTQDRNSRRRLGFDLPDFQTRNTLGQDAIVLGKAREHGFGWRQAGRARYRVAGAIEGKIMDVDVGSLPAVRAGRDREKLRQRESSCSHL